MEEFNRNVIKICVAQICQVIGWTSIQSSPIEILTDLLQEYLSSLGRIANNYATLYGQCVPNLHHVALAFKDMDISVSELEEFVTYVEPSTVLDIPKYPIQKESHLNHLKPGSREVLTRPVHIHEHLPPMHPHLEDQEYLISKSPLTVEISTSDSLSPLSSPKSIFKKPGDPVSNDARRGRHLLEDEVRPLREISSVMMTTSGFLSPAREGKLPEARTQPMEFNTSLSPEGATTVDQHADNKIEKKKKTKPIDFMRKIDKENKIKEDQVCDLKETEEENKGKKLVNIKETFKLKALKTGALKVSHKPPSPSVSMPKKIKLQSSPTANHINSTVKQSRIKSPKIDKRPISPSMKDGFMTMPQKEIDGDIKLPFEPDKHKLNIFKKISKVKDEFDDTKPIILEHREEGVSSVNSSSPPFKKVINGNDFKEEDAELPIDVETTSPCTNYEFYPPIHETEKNSNLAKLLEPKKKKKDKHKEKKDLLMENGEGHYYNSPKNKFQIEDSLGKPNTVSDPPYLEEDKISSSNFPFCPLSVPPVSSAFPSWHQPITNHLSIAPISSTNSVPNLIPIKDPEPPSSTGLSNTFSCSSSSNTNHALPGIAPLASVPNKENLLLLKKKERKKDKKLKDKIKKKKDKKDKNKIKDKSERKKLKLEKKEKAKLKLKKDKKGKKKFKEGFANRIFEQGHIAEDVLNTLQPWASDMLPKKVKIEEKDDAAIPLPKITFKLGPASPKDNSEMIPRKIVIKPVIKKEEDHFNGVNAIFQDQIKPQSYIQKIKSSKMGKFSQQIKNDMEKTSSIPVFPSVSITKVDSISFVQKWEADPNKEWICPACGRPDDGSPMIACDMCDLWYHWTCVGIHEEIESDWYCSNCIAKRSDGSNEKKKKHRKKKT